MLTLVTDTRTSHFILHYMPTTNMFEEPGPVPWARISLHCLKQPAVCAATFYIRGGLEFGAILRAYLGRVLGGHRVHARVHWQLMPPWSRQSSITWFSRTSTQHEDPGGPDDVVGSFLRTLYVPMVSPLRCAQGASVDVSMVFP